MPWRVRQAPSAAAACHRRQESETIAPSTGRASTAGRRFGYGRWLRFVSARSEPSWRQDNFRGALGSTRRPPDRPLSAPCRAPQLTGMAVTGEALRSQTPGMRSGGVHQSSGRRAGPKLLPQQRLVLRANVAQGRGSRWTRIAWNLRGRGVSSYARRGCVESDPGMRKPPGLLAEGPALGRLESGVRRRFAERSRRRAQAERDGQSPRATRVARESVSPGREREGVSRPHNDALTACASAWINVRRRLRGELRRHKTAGDRGIWHGHL